MVTTSKRQNCAIDHPDFTAQIRCFLWVTRRNPHRVATQRWPHHLAQAPFGKRMDSHAEQQADEVSEQLSQSGPDRFLCSFTGMAVAASRSARIWNRRCAANMAADRRLRPRCGKEWSRSSSAIWDVRIHTGPQSIALNQKARCPRVHIWQRHPL